jgi:hypothetical protein
VPAYLTLDLPWAPELDGDELQVRRGHPSTLDFDDGIVLEVIVLDPQGADSADQLVRRAKAEGGPGRVVLVAGRVPPEWRAHLRAAGFSWLDVSGVLEVHWPRLEIMAEDYPHSPRVRTRLRLGLQQGRAAVVQALCTATLVNDEGPTISQLAELAAVSLPAASRTVSDLAAYGLIVRPERFGPVVVQDRAALARLLAERTSWHRAPVVLGYFFGASSFDVAARLSTRASALGLPLSITGRVAAALLGIRGTGATEHVRARIACSPIELEAACRSLGIERVVRDEANVAIAADPWGLGRQGTETVDVDGTEVTLASPMRIWCDIADEPRGSEFAAQLWGMMTRG